MENIDANKKEFDHIHKTINTVRHGVVPDIPDHEFKNNCFNYIYHTYYTIEEKNIIR
jgi:hypothetical protein